MNTRTRISPARLLTALLATGVLAAGIALAPTAAAGAHTPSVSADCSELSVTLESYASSRERPTPNTVTVSVDGEDVVSERFGASISRDIPLGDSDLAHDWIVTVDAAEAQYDRTFSGGTAPCAAPVVPPAPDAAAQVEVTPATCDGAAEILVLGTLENATWGAPTATTGPATYAVTATAIDDHVFADGLDTQTFTGVLAAPLAATAAAECTPTSRPTPPTPVVPATPATPATPAAVASPVPSAVTIAAAPETLAATGADPVGASLLAVALLAVGGLLLAARGLRTARTRFREFAASAA